MVRKVNRAERKAVKENKYFEFAALKDVACLQKKRNKIIPISWVYGCIKNGNFSENPSLVFAFKHLKVFRA